MLYWRLFSGSILILLAAGSAWLDYHRVAGLPRGLWMLPLFTAAVLQATREMLDLFAIAEYRPVRWRVYAGTLAVALSGCATMLPDLMKLAVTAGWYTGRDGYAFVWQIEPLCETFTAPPITLGLVILGYFYIEIRQFDGSRKHTSNLVASIFITAYVGLLMALLAMLRYADKDRSMLPLLSTLIIVKSSDIAAYFCGRFLGRNKFVPTLSPGKTWEGTIGGVLAAGFVSLYIFTFQKSPTGNWWLSEEPGMYVAYGFGLAMVGIVGDLSISLLKREMGSKDSGDCLPGIGGMLDLLDSLLPTSVVACICWYGGMFR